MLFEEFEENRLVVLINGEYSFKVATYDESLDIERSVSRIGFQLKLGPKQNFIEDIFNTFANSACVMPFAVRNSFNIFIKDNSFRLLHCSHIMCICLFLYFITKCVFWVLTPHKKCDII